MKLFIVASIFLVYSVTYVRANCAGLKDGYHPVAGQCDAYVRCYGGQVVESQLCGDGLAFDAYGDPKHVRCKYLQQVDCSDRPALQAARATSECPRLNGIWGHCANYMECVDGKVYYKNCPEGLVFNKKEAVCDYPDHTSECSTGQLFGFSCPRLTEADYALFVDHARFPSGQGCSPEFYICLKPTHETENAANARKLNCELGELFNPSTLKCEKAEHVPGCQRYYSSS